MWNEDEINILKKYYPIEGSEVRFRLPNRSIKSIQCQASRLGITGNKIWTIKELEILLEYYSKEDLESINKRLPNRTVASIKAKANKLGLSKCSWSSEELDILIQFYPIEGPDCAYRLPKRSRDAVKTRANNLNISFNNLNRYSNTKLVYCLYFPDVDLYKVGITNDINTRIRTFGCEATLIYFVEKDSHLAAKELEQKILSIVAKANTGLLNSGNTETFSANKYEIENLSKYFEFNS